MAASSCHFSGNRLLPMLFKVSKSIVLCIFNAGDVGSTP